MDVVAMQTWFKQPNSVGGIHARGGRSVGRHRIVDRYTTIAAVGSNASEMSLGREIASRRLASPRSLIDANYGLKAAF